MLKDLHPTLPERGVVRIDRPKAAESARFVISTFHRASPGHLRDDVDLMRVINPGVGSLLTEIPIVLLSDEIEEVLVAEYRRYSGTTLQAVCDGETWTGYVTKAGEPVNPPKQQKCVGEHAGAAGGWALYGSLTFALDDGSPSHRTNLGDLFRLRLDSIADVSALYGSLLHLQQLTWGLLRGLPLSLAFHTSLDAAGKAAYTPVVEGWRTKVTELQDRASRLAFLRSASPKALRDSRDTYHRLLREGADVLAKPVEAHAQPEVATPTGTPTPEPMAIYTGSTAVLPPGAFAAVALAAAAQIEKAIAPPEAPPQLTEASTPAKASEVTDQLTPPSAVTPPTAKPIEPTPAQAPAIPPAEPQEFIPPAEASHSGLTATEIDAAMRAAPTVEEAERAMSLADPEWGEEILSSLRSTLDEVITKLRNPGATPKPVDTSPPMPAAKWTPAEMDAALDAAQDQAQLDAAWSKGDSSWSKEIIAGRKMVYQRKLARLRAAAKNKAAEKPSTPTATGDSSPAKEATKSRAKDPVDPAKSVEALILGAANEASLVFAEKQIETLPDPGVRAILVDVAAQQRQKIREAGPPPDLGDTADQLASDLSKAEASADPLGAIANVVTRCIKAEKSKQISAEASLKIRTQAMALRVQFEQGGARP